MQKWVVHYGKLEYCGTLVLRNEHWGKHTGETQYWIRLFAATGILTETESESILHDCTELVKMLTSIVKTTSSDLK